MGDIHNLGCQCLNDILSSQMWVHADNQSKNLKLKNDIEYIKKVVSAYVSQNEKSRRK
jgi:hypothetical protein